MNSAHEVGLLYRQGRERLSSLVRDLTPGQLAAKVPIRPDWTVHDVVSYLTVGAVNTLTDRVGSARTSTEDEQVAARSSTPTTVVLREWERASSQFEMLLTKLGGSALAAAVDVETHIHDVCAAVGVAGERNSDVVGIAVEQLLDRWFNRIESAGLPDVVVHDGDDAVLAGRYEASVGFRASPFEIFRAGYGRRSSRQIEQRIHDAPDPAAYVPLLCVLGPADDDVIE